MSDYEPRYLTVGAGTTARRIAVLADEGALPGLLWLGGFHSDMNGTKAQALAQWAAGHGRACVRFDYSAHGRSEGDVAEGRIGHWLEESLAVFDAFCRGPTVLVGSSMGGWIALLMLRALQCRALERRAPGNRSPVDAGTAAGADAPASVKGLVLVAPAVDFTELLMWQRFPAKVRREIEERGFWERPSEYSDEPYIITRGLIEEGRDHLLLGGMIEPGCPVHILQGVQDPDVPWNHAVELTSRIAREDVVLTLVKDGDHRLSRPEDIDRLLAAVAEFA
jgi:pimeloyl-ACP methyl ester carboxylesterase